MLKVTITYSDKSQLIPADVWPDAQAHDVQSVEWNYCGLGNRIAGKSLYWCYPEGDCFVFGSGSVRYDRNPLTEIIVAPDGKQTERRVEYLPDLLLPQVKLGWWSRSNG